MRTRKMALPLAVLLTLGTVTACGNGNPTDEPMTDQTTEESMVDESMTGDTMTDDTMTGDTMTDDTSG